MINEIDWDNAPEGAEFFADGYFRKDGFVFALNRWNETLLWSDQFKQGSEDYCERPQPKPKYEYGIEYPTNGRQPDLPDDVVVCFAGKYGFYPYSNTVSYWDWIDAKAFRIVDERYKPAVDTFEHKAPTTSTEYLDACAQVQLERAKQYDASGTGERSFEAAAEAFNCVTGKNLRGSDVCLILEMVKLVRQYSDPTRLHEDSVLDKVSYSALWAEELTRELR